MKAHIREDGEVEVLVNTIDACSTCVNQVLCPLIGAFCAEVIVARWGDIWIEKCGLYKPITPIIPDYAKYHGDIK